MSKKKESKDIKITFNLYADKNGIEKWEVHHIDTDYEDEAFDQIWDAAVEMAKAMTEEEELKAVRAKKDEYNQRIWERNQRVY